MNTSTNTDNRFAALLERVRLQEQEHERRMREDPAYRSEQERIQAEKREREAAEKRRDERQRREAIEKSRREKGIPDKFWPYLDAWRAGTDADPPPSVAKARGTVERFLAGKPEWVFLILGGSVGAGKTTAAAWFLDAPWTGLEPDPWGGESKKVKREARGMFVTAAELVKASNYDREFWGPCENAPRLVIDDLGRERLNDNALANILELLAHRHAHGLRTLITANLNRKAFEERYTSQDGGRLRDRLAESALFVELAGKSLRRPLAIEGQP
jgi:DNA replication protein DnaC